jgi:hypothetical protein
MNAPRVEFAWMVRKTSAVVLVLVGLAVPASVVAGLCANLPCCVRAIELAGNIDRQNCCGPASCDASPAQDLIQPAHATALVFMGTLLDSDGAELPASPSIAAASAFHAPPASCHDRLTLLSTLLI